MGKIKSGAVTLIRKESYQSSLNSSPGADNFRGRTLLGQGSAPLPRFNQIISGGHLQLHIGVSGGAALAWWDYNSPRSSAAPVRGPVFTAEDLNATLKKLTRAGAPFHAPPPLAPDGLAKVTVAQDPDGTPIEQVEMLEVNG